MKLVFLGTGTSQGVPVVGCRCPVCQSTSSFDQRLRCAAYIETDRGTKFLIDIGADIRQQMLRNQITDVDAILITHEHNDHTAGLDDIRPINFLHNKNVPIYAMPRVVKDLHKRFHYVFGPVNYPGLPQITLHTLEKSTENIFGENIGIIPITHGRLPIIGFRFKDLVYITDASQIEKDVLSKLKGIKVLVLNALRREKHFAHLNLDEAVALAKEIDAEHTYLTHISHLMGTHNTVSQELPPKISIAYDGLSITV